MTEQVVKGEESQIPKDESVEKKAVAPSAESGELEYEEENLNEVSTDELPSLLYTLMIAHGDPISLSKLVEVSKHDEDVVTESLKVLQQYLVGSKLGAELVVVAGQYQIRSAPRFAPFIRQLKAGKPRRLSAAALETLAIIAYRQPIVKSDIEGLRGVDSSPTLKTLMERRLIKIMGHQQTVGQPALYGTTDEFLKLFGLSTLGELPTLRDLKELEAEPGETEERGAKEEQQAAPEPEAAQAAQ